MLIMNSLYSNFQLCDSPLVHPPRTLKLDNGVRIQGIPYIYDLSILTELHSLQTPRILMLHFNLHVQGIESWIFDLSVAILSVEVIEGEGPEAGEGDVVEINYVCRRSNGYFVHSTVDQFNGESSPVILALNENQIIKGLKDVLVGMKVGGKRRALIPPSVGYVNESLKPIPEEFGPRRSLLSHAKEPLIFEVQLLKVL
ncbi:Peptidyl-prolyl cis-trans isomerase FKBP16-1, chloroplastic [Linum perenne]